MAHMSWLLPDVAIRQDPQVNSKAAPVQYNHSLVAKHTDQTGFTITQILQLSLQFA
jgi:hypothetical protein